MEKNENFKIIKYNKKIARKELPTKKKSRQ